MATELAYVGLGSNLGDRLATLRAGAEAIDAIEGARVVARSRVYESPPMGPADQPDYLNAVVAVETTLAAEVLLDGLQSIETAYGRQRSVHWGARTLDLDLLLYGGRTIRSERLSVPHPGIGERTFVLAPLLELDPNLVVPGDARSARDHLAGRPDRSSVLPAHDL